IGFILCVDEKEVNEILKELNLNGEEAYEIGYITSGGEGICLK
ncbi:phosphoribosylformylglycinamidine cyclo-ligase, partial [Clostridium saudiense]|nr:phosphoribosylformylglycinamidine cyclo-ligase [Clostridium saudiense]